MKRIGFALADDVPSAWGYLEPKHRGRPSKYQHKPTKSDPGYRGRGPKITAPPQDLEIDTGHTITIVWISRHAERIRFHAERGMSRASLIRIYGKSAILHVLGDGGRKVLK